VDPNQSIDCTRDLLFSENIEIFFSTGVYKIHITKYSSGKEVELIIKATRGDISEYILFLITLPRNLGRFPVYLESVLLVEH